jgi:hypothetical protein
VWKTNLPLGSWDGNWLPSCECPYRIKGIVPGNSYFVETLEGQKLAKALNEKLLKKYYPSV